MYQKMTNSNSNLKPSTTKIKLLTHQTTKQHFHNFSIKIIEYLYSIFPLGKKRKTLPFYLITVDYSPIWILQHFCSKFAITIIKKLPKIKRKNKKFYHENTIANIINRKVKKGKTWNRSQPINFHPWHKFSSV